jgi:hypothetical protein
MKERLTPIDSNFEHLFEPERDELEDYFSATVPSRLGGQIRVDELFKRMARSPYGQHIQTQPLRFPKKGHEFDREKKLERLGMDVDPLLHQFEAGLFVARILNHQQKTTGELPLHYDGAPMSQRDASEAIITAFVHDMGEVTEGSIKQEVGRVVGDIEFGGKTDQDREDESSVRLAVFSRVLPDVSIETLGRMEALIYHKEDSVVHDLFEAAHIVQNFNTAYLAEKAATTEQDPAIREKLINIRNDVHDKVTDAILEYAGQFTYIKEFIDFHGIGKVPRFRDLGKSAAAYLDIEQSA